MTKKPHGGYGRHGVEGPLQRVCVCTCNWIDMSMTVNFLLPVDVGWNHVIHQSRFGYSFFLCASGQSILLGRPIRCLHLEGRHDFQCLNNQTDRNTLFGTADGINREGTLRSWIEIGWKSLWDGLEAPTKKNLHPGPPRYTADRLNGHARQGRWIRPCSILVAHHLGPSSTSFRQSGKRASRCLPHDSFGRFGRGKREAHQTVMFQKGDVTSSQSSKEGCQVKFKFKKKKKKKIAKICITNHPEHTRAPLCTGGTDLSDKSASSAAQGHDRRRLIRSDSIGKAWKREGIFPRSNSSSGSWKLKRSFTKKRTSRWKANDVQRDPPSHIVCTYYTDHKVSTEDTKKLRITTIFYGISMMVAMATGRGKMATTH